MNSRLAAARQAGRVDSVQRVARRREVVRVACLPEPLEVRARDDQAGLVDRVAAASGFGGRLDGQLVEPLVVAASARRPVRPAASLETAGSGHQTERRGRKPVRSHGLMLLQRQTARISH